MEYPFKDLLPLDEVLAREGYYKDWVHLDPEVFYSLTQISGYIKTKGYGVDVRLLIAQLAEHFGLKTTQVVDLANLLQQKFTNLEGVTQSFTNNINSLVAQMEADKNTIVANATVDSEVILARGGKPTLGARLDDTTAQLAQIAVNVKSFGAKGDGVTDDTDSFFNAITYCLDNNARLFIPEGIYIVAPRILYFNIPSGKSFTMYGTGGNSIIKRKDGSTQENHAVLFRFMPSTEGDSESVHLYDFKIDSNARNNPLNDPDNLYEFEHSADLNFRGNGDDTHYINSVNIDGLIFEDAVADHVYFAGTSDSYVRTANISNVYAHNRRRARSDICVTGGLENVNISNANVSRVEAELNNEYTNTKHCSVNLSNIYCTQMIDVTGFGIDLKATNITAYGFTFGSIKGKVTNSTFYSDADARLTRFYGLIFENVDFYIKPTEKDEGGYTFGEEGYGIRLSYNQLLTFSNCNFYVDHEDPDIVVEGFMIRKSPMVSEFKEDTIKLINCWFDDRIESSISINRAGRWVLKDNDYAGTKQALEIVAPYDTHPVSIKIDGGNWDRTTRMFHLSSVTYLDLEIVNVSVPYDKAHFTNSSSQYAPVVINNERVILIDESPSGSTVYRAIQGDTLRLKTPVAGSEYEWIAINSSLNPDWKVLRSIGA